ncbi:MAG TPA: hypothetical protein VE010_21695 [Thermoanaerobaculia bacterium]|nr:hypothetical protein [Thermoanaerobaculia bacterium]
MRNEMIGAIVRRAIEHPEFRRRLLESPQDALQSHGFPLESAEMEEIERIRTTIGDSSDAEQQLVSIAENYGVHPRPNE